MSNERETRYAEAIWGAQPEDWRDRTLPEDFDVMARAAIAIADVELAGLGQLLQSRIAAALALAQKWEEHGAAAHPQAIAELRAALDGHAGEVRP